METANDNPPCNGNADWLKCTTSVAEERLLILDSEAPYEESMATTC